ncbi:hypothetical protein [Sphingobacterium multivorum]|uniref:hypothetical protein n=1 Tax=Sphingobacterium multivorum TaxID=28454 RepID=UPI003DA5054D
MEQAVIDPFQNINFTNSLKESVKKNAGLIYLILKEINEMNRLYQMSIEEQILEPDYDIRLTEIQTDPEYGVICRIVFDGVEYK